MIGTLTHTSRYLLLVLVTMSLIACGFQLRGNVTVPDRLKVITLTSDSGSDSFDRALRIALSRAGIMIIDQANATPDTLNVKINAIASSDTELARDANNDISQLQRRLSAYYFIRQADGKSLYGPRTITTTQTLANQNAEESAKISYNQAQTESMHQALANQLLYDLSYAPL